jgi:hypothetical protein
MTLDWYVIPADKEQASAFKKAKAELERGH